MKQERHAQGFEPLAGGMKHQRISTVEDHQAERIATLEAATLDLLMRLQRLEAAEEARTFAAAVKALA